MRARLMLATLVGLLFCSLATLETAELAKLADDTSNDFSLLNSEKEACSAIIHQSLESQPKTVPTTGGSERPKVRRRAGGSSYPANDCLHFLCIMRT
jgi:hypothetical protein